MDIAALRPLVSSVSFVRSVFVLGTGTAVGQAIALLATPLLTRLYTPAEFGEFSVFMAIASVFLVVSSSRYELAIALPTKQSRAELLFWLALLLNAILALALLLIGQIVGARLSRLFGASILSDYVWLLPLVVLFGGSYKALNYWAIRRQNFSAIGKTKLAQNVAMVAIQAGVGLAKLGSLGLVVGWAVGQAAGSLTLWNGSGLGASVLRKRRLRYRAWCLIRKYDRFPKYDVPGSAVNVASEYLPNILLAALAGPDVAGLYLLASRILSTPSALVGQAVAQVLLGSVRSAGKGENLAGLARNIVTGLALLILLPSVLVIFFGQAFFTWAFGYAWSDAGVYASWMMFGVAVQFIYSPVSMVLVSTNGQRLNLVIHLSLLVTKAAALFYGCQLGGPKGAVTATSLFTGIGYLMGLFVTFRHLRTVPVNS